MSPATATTRLSQTRKTSCTECYRRKQKCDRAWPCNHCNARKIAHQCRYRPKIPSLSPKHGQPHNHSIETQEQRLPVQCPMGSSAAISASDGIAAVLEDSGFMHSEDGLIASLGSSRISRNTKNEDQSRILEAEINAAATAMPSRCSTDLLIQYFLDNVNYFYYVIYPPQLMQLYTTWWSQRALRDSLSPVTTCFLLRICAYSAQFLDISSQRALETDLCESVQSLSQRCQDAATRLSTYIEPGTGGLLHVQQLFLAAPWFKAEARYKDAWHALGAAIREGQEIGLHTKSSSQSHNNFDEEMRRRTWCVLYIWDWLMASWLDRPLLINHERCVVQTPSLALDADCEYPQLVSPFLPMKLLTELCQRLIPKFGPTLAKNHNVPAILGELDQWLDTCPAIFSLSEPDTSLDEARPFLRLQRDQFHVLVVRFKFGVLKPCLTKPLSSNITRTEEALRSMAVNSCLGLVSIGLRMFDYPFPPSTQAYIATCALFDNATLLASAVIHDELRLLPHRPAVLRTIALALSALERLSHTTRNGAMTFNILQLMVKSMPLDDLEAVQLSQLAENVNDNVHNAGNFSQRLQPSSTPALDRGDVGTTQSNLESDITFPGFENMDSGSLDMDNSRFGEGFDTSYYPSVEDFAAANLGGLEDVWSWEELGLTPLSDGQVSIMFRAT